MNDKNLALRQAYRAILSGNITVNGVGVPVYNLFVPQGYPACYIVIQSQSSSGRETKGDQDRDASIQFAISTRMKLNSGAECDHIANKIMELCYPNRQSVISGCLSMELASDTSLGDIDPKSGMQIVERFITFSHIITS